MPDKFVTELGEPASDVFHVASIHALMTCFLD